MFCPTSSLIICSSWLSPGLLWSQQITLLRGDAYRNWALQRGKDGTEPRRCVLLVALYPTIWGKRSCAGLQHLFLCAVVPKHLPGRRRRLKGMVAIFLWKAFLGAFLVTNHIFWLYQGTMSWTLKSWNILGWVPLCSYTTTIWPTGAADRVSSISSWALPASWMPTGTGERERFFALSPISCLRVNEGHLATTQSNYLKEVRSLSSFFYIILISCIFGIT